ncbi:NADPH-cytochrome P450 reductase [Tulasnella sp. 417]|nr:NADPH-cytochrome P450 reductase [Tulasnella sp. 417]
MTLSNADLAVLGVTVAVGGMYIFRGSLFNSGSASPSRPLPGTKPAAGADPGVDPRDFVAKMKAGKKRLVIFYGSQTGTAEEYAIRLAKEAKSRFGLGSLVCDPEEYDFENLDELPEDCAAIFVVATYGEGEPTDNAVQLMQNLGDESFAFSKGEHRLEGLKYVVFGLGNKTYEHYNAIARILDNHLETMGAVRIGERGEGDDDKSMEEDYLAWKDGMWAAFSQAMGVEEGAGAESPDFVVSEVSSIDQSKVYLGELSARAMLKKLGTDKEYYNQVIHDGCLKLGEVLQLAAGNDIHAIPNAENTTPWNIPFDVIISAIPRLQPRYYSISSSPKLHPNLIHVTCVVLKYESLESEMSKAKWVFGVGSNYILNLKMAHHGETAPLLSEDGETPAHVSGPTYAIHGPRSAYASGEVYKAPVHVRRSTFRLPTNPKSPVIMIGPGTGVAPFRGFVQERVALARKAIEKNGPDALKDWGQMYLYYGCRGENEDYLYKDEWPSYAADLKGKFTMRTAFSRSGPRKPDGSKIYVQDLFWEDRQQVADAVLNQKAYIYICGDAKNMSKQVEDTLAKILADAKGVSSEEGHKEVKTLKERSRLMLDVWS